MFELYIARGSKFQKFVKWKLIEHLPRLNTLLMAKYLTCKTKMVHLYVFIYKKFYFVNIVQKNYKSTFQIFALLPHGLLLY